jgi:hypothetical protein
LVSLRRYMRMGGKLILHSTSRGAASGSVGRPVPRGSEGSVGVGNRSEISEIVISGDLRPSKSPQRRVGQGWSVGAHRVGTGLALATGSVGRGR